MSENYKRALVRSWCLAVAAAPFLETVNRQERPAIDAPVWFTIEWQAEQVEPLTFNSDQETGQLAVIVGGAPNLGDSEVATALDGILGELLANVDPQGQLTLERGQATAEDFAGSAERWYRLQVPIAYRYIT